MKFKPQVKVQALEVYRRYWDSYTKGDLKNFASSLDDQFEMIGTSESERCHTKAEGIEFLKAQLHEVVGKAEMRNRQIDVVPVEHLVLINEQCDIYVLFDSDLSAERQVWNFYSKIRISTLLRETKEGWKVTQQHGSFPDMRVGEGETIALEKISKENLELKDAVKRRTAELEHKNRELAIEAALERVRAMTMAMRTSEDVGKCIVKMFSELTEIGVYQGTRFGIGILNNENGNNQLWTARKNGDEVNMHTGNIDMAAHPLLKSARQAWKEQVPFHKYVLEGEDLLNYYRMLNNAPDYKIQIPLEHLPEREIQHCFIFEHGFFYAFSPCEFQPDLIHITKRFSSLFEQTYRRYLDLVKAETQAREAQIEAALERVRAKAMSMHSSTELKEVVHDLRKQMGLLGQKDLETCVIHLNEVSPDFVQTWAAAKANKSGEALQEFTALVPKHGFKIIEEALEAYSSGLKDYVLVNEGEKLLNWFEFLKKEVPGAYSLAMETSKDLEQSDFRVYWSFADFKGGALLMITLMPPLDTSRALLRRFANVFGLAYRRFADLKQAEAQARESQIQLALERVRARTMAMQHSDELAEAAFVLFQQLQILGIVHERINIGVVREETKTIDFWITEQGGNQINIRFTGRIDEPTTLSKVYSGWKKNKKSMVIDLSGEDLSNWLMYLKEEIGIPFDPAFSHNRRVQTVGFFSKGMLVVTTPEPLPYENLRLLEKFAGVFDLTYTRFSDLKHAEAQAREAQIEVALERIRSRALAMQSSTELSEVVKVLRDQMGILGQQDLEASVVHLYSEDSPTFDSWYAFRAGEKIIDGQATFYLENSVLAKEFLELYLDEITEYPIEVKGEKLKEWLAEIKRNAPKIAAYWGDLPPEKQFYHFSDFSGGALLMVSHENLTEETQMLQKRCASVFELAYKRFLDLVAKERQDKELLEEKQRLELTLKELKATQAQLIQSEKMASLGELTAGIAHEIQNPLNFVNNFSEVSNELIDEVGVERAKNQQTRDEKLIGEILADVKENLSKITLHGKRADAIVKGMLEHSRANKGEKSLTNLNALVEEFVKLSYHGLRAKDKTFNADFKLDLDPDLPKVNVVASDIGRVILNLVNNAFYAVNEKAKSTPQPPRKVGTGSEGGEGYQPKVIVSSKKTETGVELSVSDNGPGIPDSIKEKIFQPFFTTKPTGEGTGLGLSLSYDIVKAHGGELTISSQQREYTTCTFRLSI